MQIQGLNIDRFGRKTNLTLDGVTNQLNVVYGPNGAGKSTVINFIRWMLYGNYNDQVAQYVGNSFRTADGIQGTPAAGSITVSDGEYVRSISRQDDGSRYGRVAVDGDDRYARQSHHFTTLLGDISQSDFDLLYTPDFSRDRGLGDLLQGTMARGIDLVSQHIPSERVQELRLRIDNYRRDMDGLPWRSGDLTALLDQKRTIERRLETITEDTRRRRAEYDLEYEELNRRIQDAELEIERLRTDWHAKDQDVSARRRELELAWAEAEEAKQEYLRRRRTELADMDANITRVRSMQADIQRRYDRLQTTLRQNEVDLDRTVDRDESACLVQSIAKQLDDMREIDYPESQYVNRYRSTHRYRGSRAPVTASIDHLRGEVGRLCDSLQREKGDDRVRAMADELEQLRQCENGMQRWLSGLVTQRDQIANEIDEAERHGVSLIVDDPNYRRELNREFDRLNDLEIYEPLRAGRLRAVKHSCDGYEPIDPISDSLLVQLTRQRDAAHTDLQTAERLLHQLMQRRHDLESALTRLTDRELESARRELAELESNIRAAEERERLQRLINETEAEIARLRDSVRNSPVADHAAKILHRLTSGQYRNLRIDSTRNVSVEDSAGAMVPIEHISRGIRDQVYLSFCLAIITEYRRRGVQLPFILNDAFVNVDSTADDRLASVLREFAGMGQQVLVFTRHEHVANMLRNANAKYLQLTQRQIVQPQTPAPIRTEAIDQVRFRPRSESVMPTAPHQPMPPTTPLTPIAPQRTEYAPAPTNFTPTPTQSYRPTTEPLPPSQPLPPIQRTEPSRTVRPIEPSSPYPTFQQSPPPATRRTDDYEEYDELASRYRTITTPTVTPVVTPVASAPTTIRQPTFSARPIPPISAAPRTVPPVTQMAQAADTLIAMALGTPIEATGTVDPDLASRLRTIGIVTADDFLQAAPAQVEDEISRWGMTTRPIRRWQSQLALRTTVPGIGADDARVLVACGVNSINSLATANVDVLCDRVIQLMTTHRGDNAMRGRTRDHYRNRVNSWIQSANTAKSARGYQSYSSDLGNVRSHEYPTAEAAPPHHLDDDPDYVYTDRRSEIDRLSPSQDFDRSDYDRADDYGTSTRSSNRSSNRSGSGNGSGSGSGNGSGSGSGNGSGSGSGNGNGSGSGSGNGSGTGRSSRSSRSNRSSSSSSSSSSERGSRSNRTRSERTPRTPRKSRSRSSRSSRSSRDKETKLRFYLSKSDPVVDAPTIGPKMAERLHKIGILTVEDLLNTSAADIASRLDHSKTDVDDVRQWQQQSNLACRIPQMRGHDAQILVACGITTPNQLAAMDADELWAIIRPFNRTSECKRIIRNGKKPDKAEIVDWIEWAQSSRTLAAA